MWQDREKRHSGFWTKQDNIWLNILILEYWLQLFLDEKAKRSWRSWKKRGEKSDCMWVKMGEESSAGTGVTRWIIKINKSLGYAPVCLGREVIKDCCLDSRIE